MSKDHGNLPSWDEVDGKVYFGKEISPLEHFIYYHAPNGHKSYLRFIRDLSEAIEDIR